MTVHSNKTDDHVEESNWRTIPLDGKIPLSVAKGWAKCTTQYEIPKGANYGIPAGPADGIGNGLFIIDCDRRKEGDRVGLLDGVEVMELIVTHLNDNEEWDTPQVATGSGGRHIYFEFEDEFVRQGTNVIAVVDNGLECLAKIDTRGRGGYVVGPGSIHPDTGKSYEWIEDFTPEDRPVARMPQVLKQLILGTHMLVRDGRLVFTIEKAAKKIAPKPALSSEPSETVAAVPLELLEKIVMGLKKERAEDRTAWRDVVWAIKSAVGDAGLDVAIDFSKQSRKYQGAADVAGTMADGNGSIGMGSLWHWLKEDNRKLFEELQAEHRKEKKEGRQFRVDEEYYTMDLINELTAITWKNEAALQLAFRENAPKVLFRTYGDSEWYMKKSKKEPFYPVKRGLTGEPIFYLKEDEDGPPRRKRTSFAALANNMMNDIPRYNGITFMPSNPLEQRADTGRDMNIWPGFKAKLVNQLDMAKVQPILDHIMKVWASDNQEYYDYLMAWIRHIIMKPQKKTRVAIVLRSGKQQIGKGLIADDFLRKLVFGTDIAIFDSGLDFLTQRFNEHLVSKIFAVADELTSIDGDYHGTFDIMKSMITCSQMGIEIKGGRKFQADSFINMMLLTNNSFSVKIEKNDRRYFILDCNECYDGNNEYFNWMLDNYINQDCADHFLTYMCQYETSVNLCDIPVTQLKQDMIEQNLSSAERFARRIGEIKEYCKECEETGEMVELTNTERRMAALSGEQPSSTVYGIYEDWCRVCGEKPLRQSSFTGIMKTRVQLKKTKKCNVFCF